MDKQGDRAFFTNIVDFCIYGKKRLWKLFDLSIIWVYNNLKYDYYMV